jgi:hypothetical protein
MGEKVKNGAPTERMTPRVDKNVSYKKNMIDAQLISLLFDLIMCDPARRMILLASK